MFDQSARIWPKPADDQLFWGVKDLTAFWGIFIDDVFELFSGNYEQAQ